MIKRLPLILLVGFIACNEESIENYNEAEILITIELPKEINETSGLEIINNNFRWGRRQFIWISFYANTCWCIVPSTCCDGQTHSPHQKQWDARGK